MKIIGIDRTHSSADWVVFRPDGQISDAVAKHFLRLYSERSDMRDVEVKLCESLVYAAVVNLPCGFAALVAQLLMQAEVTVAKGQAVEQQTRRLEADQRDETLKRISNDEGLPIL